MISSNGVNETSGERNEGGRRPGADGARWLVPLNRAGAGSPAVICFPPAGCGPTWFRPFARLLDRPTYGVELPGRGVRVREPLAGALDQVVEDLLPHLASLVNGAPPGGVTLVGHSLGAVLLFEVARRLGDRVPAGELRLIVSGRSPPALVRPTTRHLLPDDDLVQAMVDLGAAPEPFAEPELRAVLLPMLRADLRLCESHPLRPGRPLPFPLTAIAGADDPEAPPAAVAAWASETAAGFEMQVWPGDHFFLARQFARLAALV